MRALHNFKNLHIDKDCSDLSGHHKNALFFNCTFKDLKGLTLEGCDLNRSKFMTDSVSEALPFTLTLACGSFNNVTYSPLLFELMLYLLTTTNGNDELRDGVAKLLGESKMKSFTRLLRNIE